MGKTLGWELVCSCIDGNLKIGIFVRTNAHVFGHAMNIHLATLFQSLATQRHRYPTDGGSMSRYPPCIGGTGGRSTIALLLPLAPQA